MIEDEPKKGFVWYSLRVSFWVMIGVFVIMILPFLLIRLHIYYFPGFLSYFLILLVPSVIFTFVVSIIHLRRYKEKTFAVISLVFSVLGLAISFLLAYAASNFAP